MVEQFLARDVYPEWERQIHAAAESIWILTPYLDQTAVRLLGRAKDVADIVLVTDLEPEAGPANYRKKLLAIKELLEAEIDVRSLARLHAKVLVVDGVTVIAGSQNFTSYARRSKEVSVVSDLGPTAASATLSSWVEMAKPVEVELVERLLEATDEEAQAVDLAIAQLQSQVLDVSSSLDEERTQRSRLEGNGEEVFSRAAALQKSAAATPWRFGMGTAYLIPNTANSYSNWSRHGEYQTMYGTNARGDRSGIDLTRWLRGDITDPRALRLRHLHFYPMIHLPAGRMVLARIAQTRITYVKHSVRFTRPKAVGGERRYLTVEFPKKLKGGANVIIKVRPWPDSYAGHQIGVQFDGANFMVRWESPATGPTAAQAAAAASVVLADLHHPSRGAILLQELLKPIKFAELRRNNKNAAAFFEYEKHELKLIDFGDAHIFVALKTS